jgi:hypothetical protein
MKEHKSQMTQSTNKAQGHRAKMFVFCVLFVFWFLCFGISSIVAAPTEYTLLEPLPLGENNEVKTSVNAGNYIPGLFRFAIALAGVLAVVRLIWAGIQYMSTDAFSGKSEAKNTIENALWGLLLAFSAYAIVFTIGGKRLTEFNLDITLLPISPTPVGGGGTTPTGRPMTPAEIAESDRIRQILEGAGVDVNADPCTQGQTKGCTNLNGLREQAIQGLISLKSDCRCVIRVTGGTEGGHQTHRVGQAIVDLSDDPSLRSWLKDKKYLVPGSSGAVVTLSNGRKAVMVFERAGQGNSTGDHWHTVF